MKGAFKGSPVSLQYGAKPEVSDAFITCSFPVILGGVQFTESLRTKLKGHYSLNSDSSIYVDSHTSTRLPPSPGQYYLKVVAGNGQKVVIPMESPSGKIMRLIRSTDKRPEGVDFGAIEPSARRDDWQSLYYKALENSNYFLAILSAPWFNSLYCKKEFELAVEMRQRRLMHGEKSLKLVALSLGTKKNNLRSTKKEF